MTARIYKPARTAMQSGTAKSKEWVLDYEPEQPRTVEPLMGWTSSADMKQEVHLVFDTAEEAVAYCERHGIPYQVFEIKAARAPADLLRRQFRLSTPRGVDALRLECTKAWTHQGVDALRLERVRRARRPTATPGVRRFALRRRGHRRRVWRQAAGPAKRRAGATAR